MEPQENIKQFGSRLKDIIVLKDQVEDHLLNALEQAVSKDDLVKLNTTVVKLERILISLKEDIGRRIASFEDSLGTASSSSVKCSTRAVTAQETLDSFLKLTNLQNGGPQPTLINVPRRDNMVLKVGTHTLPQKNMVNSSKPGYKNPDIPDSQRIYIPKLGKNSTEQSLYQYFSRYGRVVDCIVFQFPNDRPNAAAVGFDTAVVKDLVSRRFLVDGQEVEPRPYYSKDSAAYHHSKAQKQSYQLYCGGIPGWASQRQIADAIAEHCIGTVRDVRVVYLNAGESSRHRGFAYVNLEKDEDADYLIAKRQLVYILNKEVDCRVNTSEIKQTHHLSGPLTRYGVPSEFPYEKAQDCAPVRHMNTETFLQPPQNSRPEPPVQNVAKKWDPCIICKVNLQNCVLLWCEHTETCLDCGRKLGNCPKCAEPVVSTIARVY